MTGPSGDASVEEDQTDAASRRAAGEFVRGVARFGHAIGERGVPTEPGR